MSIAYDEHLRCLFANRRFAEFFGFTTRGIVGRHLREIVGEDPYQEIKPHFDRVLQGQRTTYRRTRVLDTGERRHLEVELIPHLDKDGRSRGLFAVTSDVTERQREEELRVLSRAVAELIAAADTTGAAVQAVIRAICEAERWDCGRYFRPAADGSALRLAEAWGIEDRSIREFLIKAREIEQLPGIGLIGEAWRARRPLWVPQVAQDPRALRTAYPPELLAGGTFVFPVMAQGAVIGVLAFNSRERRAPDERLLQVILDIGGQIGQFLQRKRAEEQLRESEASLAEAQRRTQELIEVLPNPIFFKGTDGRYLGVNKAWERYFAIPREAFIGKTVHDLYPDNPEIADRLHEMDLALWDNPGTQIIEQTIRTRDGKEHEAIYYKATFTHADGRVAGLIGTIIDITERKRAEGSLRETERRLREANARLQMLIESSPLAIYTRDPDGLLTSWNPAAERMYGWKAAEVLGKPLPSVPDESRASSDALRMRLLSGESFIKHEARRRKRDGSPIDIDAFLGPLRDADGKINGILAIAADITERKRAEEDLRRFRAAIDVSGDAILLIDRASMRYIDVNQTLCDLVGYAREEILRMAPMELFDADRATLERDYDALIADPSGKAVKVEGHYRRRDGTLIPIETQRRALRVKDGWIIVGSARDITERKQAEERVRHMAAHDSLTGLPNRMLFADRLSQAISLSRRDARQCALLYLDLDKFKPVNDTYGHDVGDQLLKRVAERLRGVVRESDTVARVGGDEFTVLLLDIASPQNAVAVAEKIITALTTPFRLEGCEVRIGTSIGIAFYPADAENHETLVKKADAAMYAAKAHGVGFRFSGVTAD